MLIKISDSVRLFGVKDGLSFVFGWYIGGPTRRWYLRNVLGRQHCSHRGLYCEEKNCEYKHYKRFPKQPKIEIWDWCEYCGESSATKIIPNPNTLYKDSKDKPWWKVCNDCDETIQAQDELGMAISFGNVAMKHGFADEMEPHVRRQMDKAKAKIEEIEKRTGKKSVTLGITKTESGFEARNTLTGKEV